MHGAGPWSHGAMSPSLFIILVCRAGDLLLSYLALAREHLHASEGGIMINKLCLYQIIIQPRQFEHE